MWQAETPGGSLTDPKARYDWLHTDHLGTPILATTKEGRTSWKAIAESFGSTQIIEQDIEMNLRFPGQYYDQETQTHYNFHRDYRPNAGRYLQSDPIGLEGGNNLYVYSAAKPLMDFDSTGLFASGRWVKEPYISDIRVPRLIGFDFVSPYMDWFCYLNMIRLHWQISGSVSFEVECIDKCEKWNINGNIFMQKQTHGDLGRIYVRWQLESQQKIPK